MSKSSAPDEPATAAFLATLTPEDRGKRELVLSLSEAEQAALPSRLRALTADERTIAWNAAKAERDAAIATATALVDPEDPESDYLIADPKERWAKVAVAKDAWAARKAELTAEG